MNIIGRLKEKITAYADVYIKLLKLNFIGHTAKLLSYLMFGMICLFLFFCIILFTGFALTEVFILAGLSKMVSFFITIVVYLILLVIVTLLRKNITRFFAGTVIRVMTEEEEKDNE